MIRVTIELVPNGWEKQKSTIGVIEIGNITPGAHKAAYMYRLKDMDAEVDGRITNFPREELNVYHLVQRVLKDINSKLDV